MDKNLNTNNLIISVLAISVLAGCSSAEKRAQANRGFEYEEASLRATPLMIPAGLAAPNFNNDYIIPKETAAQASGVTGIDVDVRPPTQVLPLVRGSQILENGSGLWFYQQRLDQPLQQELNQALTDFFKDKKADARETSLGWNSNGAPISAPKQRFSWQLTADEVRRAVSLEVKLVEGEAGSVLAQNKQKDEAALLNAFSLYYQAKLTQQQDLLDKSPIQMELQASQGRLLVSQGYDRSWKRLVTLLPQLGFSLTNRQQALGYVDVEFDGLKKGKWSELALPALTMPEQAYRVQLGDLGEQSSITLSDKNKVPVSADILRQFADTLIPAFERTDLLR